MSFYDDASLVVIPSGYKTSKVYAEKPTDGSGDLAFTRTGDTATRVNSAGLIERVRTNLILQSNTFNTTWANTSSTETGGQSGYDGTSNAWLLAASSAGGFISQNLSIAGLVTFSIYAKAGSQIGVTLYSSHAFQGRYFNLSTGALGGTFVAAPLDSKIESIGSGWYRCSITVSATATSDLRVYVSDGTANVTGNILIQAAQAEAGDIATPYIPTLTAAVSTGPVANVPRLDYLGSTCPRLLLEPQRTNLVTYSEQFDNAAWTKSATATTITANSTISPSGYQDADTWTINAAGARYVAQTKTVTAGAVTASFFVKKGTSDWFYIRIEDGANYAGFTFNVSTGQLGQSVSSVLTPTASIVDYGNGWYRCIVTTTVAGTSVLAAGWVATSASTISGTLGASLICWGAQLEAGAYATSYIPTLAASATRGADACSKTGISSLIGQTEGTIFVDFRINGLANFGTPISVNNGTAGRYVWLTIFSNGDLRAELYNDGTQASITYSGAVVGGRYKMAFGYKTNDFVLYVNGTQVGTDNSGTTFSGTTLSRVDTDLTNASVYSTASESLNQALLFKTRLTNAELATLTTL